MSDQSPATVLDAVATVDVQQLPQIVAAGQQLHTLQAQAERVTVHDEVSAETATTLLGQAVAARKHAESQRLGLTRPLKEVIDKLIAAERGVTGPLSEVERILKRKVADWQAEQRRIAEEHAAALEAEAQRQRDEEEAARRAAEDEARREREAAARAAAEAEAAARREREEAARRERQQRDALSQSILGATNEQLAEWAREGEPDEGTERGYLARAELDARQRRADADAEAQRAREAEEAAREAERLARESAPLPIVAPRPPAPATTVRGASGSVSSRTTWAFEVEDMCRLARAVAEGRAPVEYLQVAPALGQAVRRKDDPVRDLPGVRIYADTTAAFRQS